MIFRLGVKEFIRNIGLNLLIILQLAATLALSIFLTSTIEYRLAHYLPFKEELSSKGLYVLYRGFDYDHKPIDDKNKIISELEKVKEITATYTAPIIDKHSNSDDDISYNITAYDEKIFTSFKPRLKSGKWLDKRKEGDYLPAVISHNSSGIKTGDILALTGYNDKSEEVDVKVKIIGTLRDGAKVFSKNSHDAYDNYLDLYMNYNYEQELRTTLFVAVDDMDKLDLSYIISGKGFITFDDDITDEQARSNLGKIDEYCSAYPLDEVNARSISHITYQLYLLLPIIIGVLMLVIVSTLSISAINTSKQMRNYAIYYMCGSQWRSTSLISLVSYLVVAAFSFVLSWTVIVGLSLFGILDKTSLRLGIFQILVCLVIILIGLCTSVLTPYLMIRKTTPRQIISTND